MKKGGQKTKKMSNIIIEHRKSRSSPVDIL